MSSPFSEHRATVSLHVEAGSPLAEVFLIDHAFALVDRSIGELDAQVPQGVYKVKARLGEASAERLIVLNDDLRVDLSGELPVSSPAPIMGTSRTHEYHMDAARDESADVAVRAGSGAQIFLLARRWSSASRSAAAQPPESGGLSELSLHRPGGESIAELGASSSLGPPGLDPVRGTTVEVDPGAYILRWSDSSGITAEQSVHAVAGWQSQVFLLEEADGGEDEIGHHHRVSVLMSRGGFAPDDPRLRIVEEARSALADERKVASRTISETLFAKFDNPMLGLFGAHLMLLAGEAEQEADEEESRRTSDAKRPRAPVGFDQALFDLVVDNLGGLLGPQHPDVVALSTRTADPRLDLLEPVTAPPMLWRSWLLLLEASNDAPQVVPVETWRRTVKLLPLRPFLVWSPPEEADETESGWAQEVARALQASTSPATVRDRVRSFPPAGALTTRGRSQDDMRRGLSRQLLAPRAAIDDLIAGRRL